MSVLTVPPVPNVVSRVPLLLDPCEQEVVVELGADRVTGEQDLPAGGQRDAVGVVHEAEVRGPNAGIAEARSSFPSGV
ncbi:MAG TPA: hypothetical protein VGI50_07415 [Solirubrobacteraceae bacterium]|jgi:hypothetical protein